jgi:hypothetical protein
MRIMVMNYAVDARMVNALLSLLRLSPTRPPRRPRLRTWRAENQRLMTRAFSPGGMEIMILPPHERVRTFSTCFTISRKIKHGGMVISIGE